MRHTKGLLAALFAALLITGFNNCRTCNCIDDNVSFHFAGFTHAELNSITVKKYSRGSHFSQLLDSMHFRDETDYRLQQEGDTTYLNPRSAALSVAKNADWQIVLPAAGRTFHITEIDLAQVRDDCSGKSICINPVRSMHIDGTLLQGPIIIPVGFVLQK